MTKLEQIQAAYQKASRRLLLLDYDGTLRAFAPTPGEAVPTRSLLQVLKQLGGRPENDVVIISGRDCLTLDQWFGALPLAFTAEHGLFVRSHGGDWQALTKTDARWRIHVERLMQHYVNTIPGSLLEEKTGTLSWHYRQSPLSQARVARAELLLKLKPLAQKFNVRIREASKVLEVGSANVSKGQAARYWLDKQKYDFILAMGDEETDEDMFRALPAGAHSIKVRPGPTRAETRLQDPAATVAFLATLAQL